MNAKRITIREKKRVRGKTSTRRVPMPNKLHAILGEWLRIHPGGRYTFCFEAASFGKRTRFDGQPVEPDEAHKSSSQHFVFQPVLQGPVNAVLVSEVDPPSGVQARSRVVADISSDPQQEAIRNDHRLL